MASGLIGSSERQASCTDVSQKRQPYQNRVNTANRIKYLGGHAWEKLFDGQKPTLEQAKSILKDAMLTTESYR